MFDENVCFTCGSTTTNDSLYCSEKCRLQDCGDFSASASNSSVAPSSASSSPSRTSPKISPRYKGGVRVQDQYSKRISRASSDASSPSLHTSDLPEYSDNDIDIINLGSDPKGRLSRPPNFQTPAGYGHGSQKLLDSPFWKSRYADLNDHTPSTGHNRDNTPGGSKSVPGSVTTLHYVRKPGPINTNNNGRISQLTAGFSPHKTSSGHKRYGSEYGYPTFASRTENNGADRLARQGSIESATSSTPRSKSAVILSTSSARVPMTGSDSTLASSLHKTSSSSPMNTVRHVSDTVVHTLRKAIEPFTAVHPAPESGDVSRRSSVQPDSLALSALKDVARSHNVGASKSVKKQLTDGKPKFFVDGQQRSDESLNGPPKSSSDIPAPERGRSRRRHAPSRSPSPPSWASWAEDEPIHGKRGRSAKVDTSS
ncbi:hypothetical protein CPB86DRAFT_331719 [Serendipita vermifera]|nr:hypothetical protein CPB86DRAFT_331719 [Serendipita vermifera]